jgi:serine/threonine protein kinase
MLGKGGAGEVFLAYDTSLNRWVAIKRIPATDSDLFQEATVLASFQHPNIVTVHDVILEGGEMLLVMEFVQGQTLEELAEPMTEDTFRDFAVQCLEGLGAAHEKSIVHRDIKPGNIMFAPVSSGGYRAKILDFGQSRLMAAPCLQTMDQSGAVVGSVYMMSPEQLNHEELDLRTDFYSLGCVFYQSLTLQRPFTGDNVAHVLTAHLQHRFQPLSSLRPDLPRPLTAWVERLFALDRNDRPSNALEALRALKASLSASSAIKIATTATKVVRVIAAPLLKPAPEVDLAAATARVALPIPVPVSTSMSLTPASRKSFAAKPLHASSPASVSVSRVTERMPVVAAVTAPASLPIRVAAAPAVQPVPVVAAAPAVQPVSVVAAAPAVQPVPVVAAAPAVQPVPVVAAAPAVQPVPVVAAAPAVQPVSVVAAAPAVQPVSVVAAAPAVQPVSVVAAAPAVQPVSVVAAVQAPASSPIRVAATPAAQPISVVAAVQAPVRVAAAPVVQPITVVAAVAEPVRLTVTAIIED